MLLVVGGVLFVASATQQFLALWIAIEDLEVAAYLFLGTGLFLTGVTSFLDRTRDETEDSP